MPLWNENEYKPTECLPEEDECKYLLLKIVEQAVRDYLSLENSVAPIEKFHYNTASDFIFNDLYSIDYGEKEFSLEKILSILEIEVIWLRDRVIKLKSLRIKNIAIKLTTQGKEDETSKEE